jgi:hypothetical protein
MDWGFIPCPVDLSILIMRLVLNMLLDLTNALILCLFDILCPAIKVLLG